MNVHNRGNAKALIERMRATHHIKDGDKLGLVSTGSNKTSVDENNRELIVIANTADVDLDNEDVLPQAAALDYILRNRKVFAAHRNNTEHCVGTIRNIRKYPSEKNHTAWRVRLKLNNSPLANDTLEIAREGGIGVSIGFQAIEAGPPTEEEQRKYGNDSAVETVIRRWSWLELSTTCFPANVSCQTLDAQELKGATDELLETLITKGRISEEGRKFFARSTRDSTSTARTTKQATLVKPIQIELG